MKLSVNGSEALVATGGRAFDPTLPTVVFLHGAGFDHSAWAQPPERSTKSVDSKDLHIPRNAAMMPLMLMRSDQPLVDIALALNFSCQANFTRAFRQVTGQTPGQYRRSFRSK